jgi:hypothetical protein
MKYFGLKWRNQSESEKLKWSNMTLSQRKKQVEKAHEACRRKGMKKFKTKPTMMISKRGYWMIYVPLRGWVKYHHYVWEQAYGKVPKGFVLHHINFDKLDNKLENLQLLPIREHYKLHGKMRKRNKKNQFL